MSRPPIFVMKTGGLERYSVCLGGRGIRGEFLQIFNFRPLGMDFRYSVSPRCAMPTPAICPYFASSCPSMFLAPLCVLSAILQRTCGIETSDKGGAKYFHMLVDAVSPTISTE